MATITLSDDGIPMKFAKRPSILSLYHSGQRALLCLKLSISKIKKCSTLPTVSCWWTLSLSSACIKFSKSSFFIAHPLAQGDDPFQYSIICRCSLLSHNLRPNIWMELSCQGKAFARTLRTSLFWYVKLHKAVLCLWRTPELMTMICSSLSYHHVSFKHRHFHRICKNRTRWFHPFSQSDWT